MAQSRALAQKLEAGCSQPSLLGVVVSYRAPGGSAAPRGQRAAGSGGGRAVPGLGVRLESWLVVTLGRPCWERWPQTTCPGLPETAHT